MKSRTIIAERKLVYSKKGMSERCPFSIRLSVPTPIERGSRPFPVDDGATSCTISYEGLDERSVEVHGIDPIHALAQASDIDRYLRALTSKYDLYWPTGEPYFDEG